MGIVAPTPLTVVTITQGSCTHRGIAYQKEHRIVTLTTRTRHRTGRHGLGDTVRGVVHHAIDVFYTLTVGHLSHR